MEIAVARNRIKNAPKYKDSDSWRKKVDNMPDNQILAIYFRFVREGIIRV